MTVRPDDEARLLHDHGAQFLSSLADNALLIAAIALLRDIHAPEWMTPMLKLFFFISYVVLGRSSRLRRLDAEGA